MTAARHARRAFLSRLLQTKRGELSHRIAARLGQEAASTPLPEGPDTNGRQEPSMVSAANRHLEALTRAYVAAAPHLYTDYLALHGGSDAQLARAVYEILEEQLPSSSWELLQSIIEAAQAAMPSSESDAEMPADLRAGFLKAAFLGDRRAASTVIVEAVRSGRMTVQAVMLDVLVPLLRDVGAEWQHDELTSAEEHSVSMAVELALGRLYEHAARAPERGHHVVVGMARGEQHQLGARMIADLLDYRGFRVAYLGPDNESHAFARMAMDVDASAVVIGAVRTQALGPIKDAVERIHRIQSRRVPVVVGGSAFNLDPDAGERIGADAVAEDIEQVLELVEAFVHVREPTIVQEH
ncbi:MAG: B12-binding domain-containing protein [Myxococcota bacterium]